MDLKIYKITKIGEITHIFKKIWDNFVYILDIVMNFR